MVYYVSPIGVVSVSNTVLLELCFVFISVKTETPERNGTKVKHNGKIKRKKECNSTFYSISLVTNEILCYRASKRMEEDVLSFFVLLLIHFVPVTFIRIIGVPDFVVLVGGFVEADAGHAGCGLPIAAVHKPKRIAIVCPHKINIGNPFFL